MCESVSLAKLKANNMIIIISICAAGFRPDPSERELLDLPPQPPGKVPIDALCAGGHFNQWQTCQ